ncbi:hypothetical protein [Streptomyces platensis]|uniref:hypothetical protein n=1 Tax=Streptomyces platensis TaxID=58346 RepID=UPI002F918009|nr:hypothetical protein OG962_37310 [Streptomyces platensis]
MTILIDTKNEMKKSVDGLDSRVSELDRELRAALTSEITELRERGLADLKSSQHDARTSSINAGKRASEAVTAVTDLRQDVDRLHSGLEELRQDVGAVLSLLRAAVPEEVSSAAGAQRQAGAGTGNGLAPETAALPGQRQLPDKESVLDEESVPAAPVPAAAAAVPASQESAEPTQDDGEPGAGVEGEQPAPEGETRSGPGADRPVEEGQEVSRAALEAGERSSDAAVKEPYPISGAGRVWAIMRAGRVASATLVCHRDAWEFVAAQVGNHPHFRTPALEEREDGLVAAVLSGRSLVAMLLTLYRAANTPPAAQDRDELDSYADWAMASQIYYATAQVLSRTRSQEGDPVVVTIDDRLPTRP